MVLSSIMKQSCTERGRRILVDGMDILGGAGISGGKANFVGNAYMSMPVAITVEGANIMTRSFQIIGQGLTRCHPHMLSLIGSLQSTEADAPVQFRTQFVKMLHHVFSNLGLSITRGIGATVSTTVRSSSAYQDGDALIKHHEAQLLRLSANFAFSADLALLLGGRLKFEELMMGRLSDAMGAIFLGYATLHHFQRNKDSVKGLEALAESAMLQLEHEAQVALREASENFPKPLGAFGGLLMSVGIAPLGELMRPYRPPRDALTQEVSRLLTTPSDVHKMFAENVYAPEGIDNRVADLLAAMPVCLEADVALTACKKEKRQPTADEAVLIAKADALRDKLVQVDVHEAVGPLEEGNANYERPAIASTVQRQQKGASSFEAAVSAAQA
jgi:hypothetical protein